VRGLDVDLDAEVTNADGVSESYIARGEPWTYATDQQIEAFFAD